MVFRFVARNNSQQLFSLLLSKPLSQSFLEQNSRKMSFTAAPAILFLSLLPIVSTLGINCEGSALCPRAEFNNKASVSVIQLLRDVVWASSKSNSTTYASGDHVVCVTQSQPITIDAGKEIDGFTGGISLSGNIPEGGICLFPQHLSSGSLTLGQIRPLVDALLDHKCPTCGSVPVHFVDEGSNDPGEGILTFNYVQYPICDHNCISDTGSLPSSGSGNAPPSSPSPAPSTVKPVTVIETPPAPSTKSTPSTTAQASQTSASSPSKPVTVTQTGPVTIIETNPFAAPTATAQASTPTQLPNTVTTAAPTTVTMVASSTTPPIQSSSSSSSSSSSTSSANGSSTVTQPAPVTMVQGGNQQGASVTTPTQSSNTVSPSPNTKSNANRLQNRYTLAMAMLLVIISFYA